MCRPRKWYTHVTVYISTSRNTLDMLSKNREEEEEEENEQH